MHKTAILEHNEAAEEYLYSMIVASQHKNVEWLRNRLILFKEGNKMSTEEKARAMNYEGRSSFYLKETELLNFFFKNGVLLDLMISIYAYIFILGVMKNNYVVGMNYLHK